MADILTSEYGKDTGSGKKLNTGSMRKSYNTKKRKRKKRLKKFKLRSNKYVEGK
tara:strand:- start:2175 stop:2336 length:162 start_codon:yes stop_codon:yes gene_type:complete